MSSSEAPLESPEYENTEEGPNYVNQLEGHHIEEAGDVAEDIQSDGEGEYADDGADDAEAEDVGDYDHDDGYASATPHANQEDSSWWNPYVSIETLQETTAQQYGAFIGGGTILAWRGNNTGKSVVVGYRYDGKIIGRLEAAARRRVDTSERGHAHISATCRGKKKIPGTDDYWSQEYISGMGTVAWRVEPDYADDPTSVLIPMNKAWYPETYVGVIWCDDMYTWESRDCLRFIMGSKNYETDVAIYRLAISQDGDYQEALTGTRPRYPDPGERSNQHWRNVNSFQGAYWKKPRARKETRVVRIEEIPVNQEDALNTDEEVHGEEEDYSEEEGNMEEGIEGEEFEEDAEDEIQGDQDHSEPRARWQASGLDGYGEAPHPYLTPAASREGSANPNGSRPRRLPPINEDEEFHTPQTPNAFNDRYGARLARAVDGSQQGTPVRGSRTASGFRENTPGRPPSVTRSRGTSSRPPSQSYGNTPRQPRSGSRRGTPSQPPSGSTQGSTPSRPPSGSQRGTPNETPSGTRGNTPRQPTSGSRRGTPSQPPSGSQGSTSEQVSRAAARSRVNTPGRPPSVTPIRGSGGASGSHQATPTQPLPGPQRGTPNRQPSGSQRGTPRQPSPVSQHDTPRQPPSGSRRDTPNRPSSGSQGNTPTQPPSSSQRGTPRRPPSGSQHDTPSRLPSGSQGSTPRQPPSGSRRAPSNQSPPGSRRDTPNRPSSGSQGNTPTQPPSSSQRGTPRRPPSGSQHDTPSRPPSGSQGNTPRQPPSGSRRGTPSSQGNRTSAQSSSPNPIAQPQETQNRLSNRRGNGRRNPHRQARRPIIRH